MDLGDDLNCARDTFL